MGGIGWPEVIIILIVLAAIFYVKSKSGRLI